MVEVNLHTTTTTTPPLPPWLIRDHLTLPSLLWQVINPNELKYHTVYNNETSQKEGKINISLGKEFVFISQR